MCVARDSGRILLSTVGMSTGFKDQEHSSRSRQGLARIVQYGECARRCDDATMRRIGLSVGRWALRSGGRVPTLAVLDGIGEAEGRCIVAGFASVYMCDVSQEQEPVVPYGPGYCIQGDTERWESVCMKSRELVAG